MSRRVGAWLMTALLSIAALSCGRGNDAGKMTELERARSGTLEVVLLSPRGALRHGKDTFVVEFRSASGGTLVDVGTVKGSATMPMGGTPMLGSIDVKRTDVPGRYRADGDFSMAGTWRMTIQWDGAAGQSSVTLSRNVQ